MEGQVFSELILVCMAGQEQARAAAADVILEVHAAENVVSSCKIKEKPPNGHLVVSEL